MKKAVIKRNITVNFIVLIVMLIGSISGAQAADALPFGILEAAACGPTGVVGWAYDADTLPGSINVQFFIDNQYAGQTLANLPSPGINAAEGIGGDHRYEWAIPDKYQDGQAHTLAVYAENDAGGDPKIGSFTFTCTLPVVTLNGGANISENGGTTQLSANLDQTSEEAVKVRLSFSGSAIRNNDYIIPSEIIIPAGRLSGSVDLVGKNDNVIEPNETIRVDISSIDNGKENGVQFSNFEIVDDDSDNPNANGLDINKANNNDEVRSIFDNNFIGPGVIVDNFSQIGSANQFGTFTNGSEALPGSRLPVADGVVMVTGDADSASNPAGNTKDGEAASLDGGMSTRADVSIDDPDLRSISGFTIY
ncbi:MAG: hypothetical protein AAF633_23955, partial [Chloroflexota bacterium]